MDTPYSQGDNELDLFKRAMEYNEQNKKASPLIDNEKSSVPTPTPITPASAMGRKSSLSNQTDDENMAEEMGDIDIELSFFKCEKCEQWKDGESMYFVETHEAVVFLDINEDENKTLKSEVQTWCSACVLEVINICKQEKALDINSQVDEEISKLKNERLKIKRISDKK